MENIEPVESIIDIFEVLIARYGAMGIGMAMFAESAGVPFASAVVLLFSGPLIVRGSVSFLSLFLASTFGITLGSICSYILGMLGSLLSSRIRGNSMSFYRNNSTLHSKLSQSRSKLYSFWDKYGNFSVFMGQLWGFTRTFISFPAGAMRMNLAIFIIYTFLGGALFSMAAISLSLLLTRTMRVTLQLMRMLAEFSPLLLTLLLVFCMIFLYRFVSKNKYGYVPGIKGLFNIIKTRLKRGN